MEENSKVILIISAVAGSIPPILTAFLSWIDKHNTKAKNDQIIAHANNRVKFLNECFKLQKDLCDPEHVIEIRQKYLDQIEAIRLNTFNLRFPYRISSIKPSHNLLKQLILLYPANNATDWIIKILYYMFLSLTIMVLLSFLTQGFGLTDTLVITEKSIDQLRDKDIPVEIINAVESIKGKKYIDIDAESQLRNEITSVIGHVKDSDTYTSFIIDEVEVKSIFSWEDFFIILFMLIFWLITPTCLLYWVAGKLYEDSLDKKW